MFLFKIADFGVSAQITATLAKRKSFIGSPYWFVFLCIAWFNLSFTTLALIFGKPWMYRILRKKV